MFTAALFTVAKTWKQTTWPLMDDWIKKIWCVYNGILLSQKKKEILPFATKLIDLIVNMLSEVSQRKTNTI